VKKLQELVFGSMRNKDIWRVFMALIKKPVTGMKDILPAEMQLRDYVIGVIKDTYGKFGFTSIETPAVESLANLNSKQGGENEKLIFKIMKRGEKLNLETAKEENDLTDSGLRYDLTVPLVRFYANHQNELPAPFKALQMGYVWRADRPQKGRYRQFMQCDIDILGEPSNLAEIELILATTTTLGKLGFKGFQIRINERRILKAMAAYSGFPEESYDSVFITLDKMDKIGIDGVREELEKDGFDKAGIDKYLDLFKGVQDKGAVEGLKFIAETLGEFLDEEVKNSLEEIITSVDATKSADFEIVFDPTLVRGMSYYTGTIFEIAMPQYGGSCGGGGRYDKMVGKFTGQDTPACGFSIGFERIIMIMMDEGFKIPGEDNKVAYLIEKGVQGEKLSNIIAKAQEERAAGKQVLVARMNKNKKFQKEQLVAQGYKDFNEFYKNPLN
jgi:histidyl-tRNA synthetase